MSKHLGKKWERVENICNRRERFFEVKRKTEGFWAATQRWVSFPLPSLLNPKRSCTSRIRCCTKKSRSAFLTSSGENSGYHAKKILIVVGESILSSSKLVPSHSNSIKASLMEPMVQMANKGLGSNIDAPFQPMRIIDAFD